MRDEVVGELVEYDGLARRPPLAHEPLERERDDAVGVMRPTVARALTHTHRRRPRPSCDDTDEPEHRVDIALHGSDVGESPLLRDFQRRAEEVDGAPANELSPPLLLRGVHGGPVLVAGSHVATVGVRDARAQIGTRACG
jgi:hypothetical protein